MSEIPSQPQLSCGGLGMLFSTDNQANASSSAEESGFGDLIMKLLGESAETGNIEGLQAGQQAPDEARAEPKGEAGRLIQLLRSLTDVREAPEAAEAAATPSPRLVEPKLSTEEGPDSEESDVSAEPIKPEIEAETAEAALLLAAGVPAQVMTPVPEDSAPKAPDADVPEKTAPASEKAVELKLAPAAPKLEKAEVPLKETMPRPVEVTEAVQTDPAALEVAAVISDKPAETPGAAKPGNAKPVVEAEPAAPRAEKSAAAVLTDRAPESMQNAKTVDVEAEPQAEVKPLETAANAVRTAEFEAVKERAAAPNTAAPVSNVTPQGNVHTTAAPITDTSAAVDDAAPASRVSENPMIDQIVKSAKVQMLDGGSEMTLRFDPPHLGSVHMKVTAHDGIVTAGLQVSSESVKQAIQADVSVLRQALAESGIHLDAIDVSVGDHQNMGWSQSDKWNGEHPSSNGYSNRNYHAAHAFSGPANTVEFAGRGRSGVIDYLA